MWGGLWVFCVCGTRSHWRWSNLLLSGSHVHATRAASEIAKRWCRAKKRAAPKSRKQRRRLCGPRRQPTPSGGLREFGNDTLMPMWLFQPREFSIEILVACNLLIFDETVLDFLFCQYNCNCAPVSNFLTSTARAQISRDGSHEFVLRFTFAMKRINLKICA